MEEIKALFTLVSLVVAFKVVLVAMILRESLSAEES